MEFDKYPRAMISVHSSYSTWATASVVYWSEFLAIDPEVWVRFPALPDFLRSSGSGTMLGGSLSPQQGASSGCGWRNGLQLCRVAVNMLKKQPRTDDKGWSSSLRVGLGADNPSP
jgi:hypothetical protein